MDVLIDTGVLLRLIIPSDPGHLDARRAIKLLRRRGDKLITLTQNVSEFGMSARGPSRCAAAMAFPLKTLLDDYD